MSISIFSGFQKATQVLLLVVILIVTVSFFFVLPVTSKSHKASRTLASDSLQNYTEYVGVSEHVEKDCISINGECRSAKYCCEPLHGKKYACAYGGGSIKTCQECQVAGISCFDDPTICCEGFYCLNTGKNSAECRSCAGYEEHCGAEVCCESYECTGDDDECEKKCGLAFESCKDSSLKPCYDDLACDPISQEFCTFAAKKCDLRQDTCCDGLRCNPETKLCISLQCIGVKPLPPVCLL